MSSEPFNVESELTRRFFEELIQEFALDVKYDGKRRSLPFLKDGDEFIYCGRDHLKIIDAETFAYVRQLASEAGIRVSVENPYSWEPVKWTDSLIIDEACLGKASIDEDIFGEVPKKPENPQHPTLVALRGVPVSRFFRDTAWKFFPGLKKHPGYWTLFCYLLFGSWLDEESHQLLLCAEILSAIEPRDPDNSEAEKFLIRFREDVLWPAGADIRWDASQRKEKKCRQLRNPFLGHEFEEILRREHFGHWDDAGRVYLLDGSTYNRSNARRFYREKKKAAGRLPTFCKDAEFIRAYMNSLESNLFTTTIKENFRSALKVTFNLPDGSVKDAQLRILAHIKGQPQSFYFPSAKGHTVRLSTSEGIPNLKSNVRRALTRGWEEADLRSSQFAICSKLWQVPELLDFLSKGKSLWNYLFDALELSVEERELAKPVLKESIYSICYGMPRSKLKWTIAGNLYAARLDTWIAHKLLGDPLVKTLLVARDLALKRIAAESGAMTCYNVWLPVTEERQPRDIMAEIAQAWEMKLIYPAFELAQQTREFTITLYQYDGFSVHFTRRPEVWKPRIEQAINENAHRLDFMTWLEWS